MEINELKVTVDADDALRVVRAEIEKVKQGKHPLRIECQVGDHERPFVPTDGTRVTVGGMQLDGVQSIDIHARPNGIWTAQIEVSIDPVRDIVRHETAANKADTQTA